MSQSIKIQELTPNTKGNFILKFEVAEINPSLANPQQIQCKIADQTGCIDTYFNNFAQHIKLGAVYQLISFKCKVVEHSLRLQLRKDSKLVRIKHQFAFKDLFNNLSEKFYVSKPIQKVSEPVKQLENVQKKQKTKNVPSENQKPIKTEQKVEKKQMNFQEKDKSNKISKQQNAEGTKKDRTNSSYVKKESESDINKNQPQRKKVYVQKSSQIVNQKKQNKKVERESPQERTLLRNIHKFQQKYVNLVVRILTNTKKEGDKYQLIKICDNSGAIYAQFESRLDLQQNNWYSMKNFKVYKDKVYGFVVSQAKQSSWQVFYDFDQKLDYKQINFKKN